MHRAPAFSQLHRAVGWKTNSLLNRCLSIPAQEFYAGIRNLRQRVGFWYEWGKKTAIVSKKALNRRKWPATANMVDCLELTRLARADEAQAAQGVAFDVSFFWRSSSGKCRVAESAEARVRRLGTGSRERALLKEASARHEIRRS